MVNESFGVAITYLEGEQFCLDMGSGAGDWGGLEANILSSKQLMFWGQIPCEGWLKLGERESWGLYCDVKQKTMCLKRMGTCNSICSSYKHTNAFVSFLHNCWGNVQFLF